MTPHPTQAVRVTPRSNQAVEALRDVLAGSRGGRNRRRIIHALAAQPRNANRLSEALGLDYKTVRHHLSVLEDADAVSRGGRNYGAVYVPTSRVRRHWDVVEELTDAN